jgi:hypothetical protein
LSLSVLSRYLSQAARRAADSVKAPALVRFEP